MRIKYEEIKALCEKGFTNQEIASTIGASLRGVEDFLRKNKDLREIKKAAKWIGRSSRIWLEYRKCNICEDVLHESKMALAGKGKVRSRCKRCDSILKNPGAKDPYSKRYYIYSHLDSNGKCFYIGKGTNDRAKSKTMRNNDWHAVAKDGFTVKILVNNIDHRTAMDLEYNFIRQIGHDNLTNRI